MLLNAFEPVNDPERRVTLATDAKLIVEVLDVKVPLLVNMVPEVPSKFNVPELPSKMPPLSIVRPLIPALAGKVPFKVIVSPLTIVTVSALVGATPPLQEAPVPQLPPPVPLEEIAASEAICHCRNS